MIKISQFSVGNSQTPRASKSALFFASSSMRPNSWILDCTVSSLLVKLRASYSHNLLVFGAQGVKGYFFGSPGSPGLPANSRSLISSSSSLTTAMADFFKTRLFSYSASASSSSSSPLFLCNFRMSIPNFWRLFRTKRAFSCVPFIAWRHVGLGPAPNQLF